MRNDTRKPKGHTGSTTSTHLKGEAGLCQEIELSTEGITCASCAVDVERKTGQPVGQVANLFYQRYEDYFFTGGTALLLVLHVLAGRLAFGPPWLATALGLAAILVGGYPIFSAVLLSLRARQMDVDVLVAVAVGADVTVEAADVALMADDLTKVPQTIRLGRAVLRTIRQDIGFALGFNAVMLVLASSGALSMVAGAALHQVSSLAVVLNSMRLLLYRPEGRR